MMRIFLTYILPLALPTLIYLIWAAMARQRDDGDGQTRLPWFKLIVAGFVLMLAALAATVIYGGMEPGGEYRAPYSKDGKIVPGHMEPKSMEPAPGKEPDQ